MTMTKHDQNRQSDQQDMEEASMLLAGLLDRVFHRQGDQGSASGIFPVVGRGDGSLDDSYRLAEPSDNIYDYHIPLNALQGKYGPFYVHTHVNRYDRRGVLLPDISGFSQPGSNLAIYERERLAALTVESLLRATLQDNHKLGLVLPTEPKWSPRYCNQVWTRLCCSSVSTTPKHRSWKVISSPA